LRPPTRAKGGAPGGTPMRGRHEYVQARRSFTERAAPLRARLIEECDRLRPAVNV
jgi:hypothetical protein